MLIYVQANANYNLKIGINRFDFEEHLCSFFSAIQGVNMDIWRGLGTLFLMIFGLESVD